MQRRVPNVSVCIPSYNGAQWIEQTVQSALQQSYTDFEVLVLDDQSTDDTVARVIAIDDPRIRVERNTRNLGLVGNWNRTIEMARGRFIKFLFQDDFLQPDCLARLVPVLEENSSAGMVFSRRDILLENPDDPFAKAWQGWFQNPHCRFEGLKRLNHGRALFDQWQKVGFGDNWIGEPTSVLVRKRCFEEVGGFNVRMCQDVDCEMWLRLMFFYDVGFVDEALSVFRFHFSSTTQSNERTHRPWLDALWLVEGLLAHPAIDSAYPQLRRRRVRESLRALKSATVRATRRSALPSLGYYGRCVSMYTSFAVKRTLRCAPSLHSKVTGALDKL